MNELINDICMMLQKEDKYTEEVKNNLIIICSNYEIEKKTTEIAIFNDEDYNTQIIQRFLISKTVKGLTERTIKYYRNTLKFIFERINKSANIVTSDELKLYIAKRAIYDKVSDSSIENEQRVLSSFYAWMVTEEIILKNPMLKVEKVKKRKKKKKAFSDMECELIRNGCKNLREKAIVEVLFSTWCRVSEVEQMNVDDIEKDNMTVIGKGKKERTVYLNSKAIYAIEQYLQTRNDNSEALFVTENKPHARLLTSSLESNMRELGKRVGVSNCHPHRFRRTGATLALRSGMPIEKVSYLLGHESIETTQIYLDINEDEMKAAHKKYVN